MKFHIQLNWIKLNTIFFSFQFNMVNDLIEILIELNLIWFDSIQYKTVGFNWKQIQFNLVSIEFF
jgi:hypothetical protein